MAAVRVAAVRVAAERVAAERIAAVQVDVGRDCWILQQLVEVPD